MAGYDDTIQRNAGTPGMRFDGGRFDFSSGSATCEVPTRLARALCGLAMADLSATTSPQQTVLGYKVGDVSNGAITFVRAGAAVNEDARMSYWLMGW
jgi:hypothetical protein